MQTVQTDPHAGHGRSDWAGFVCFSLWTGINAALAIGLFRRAPAVAVFLIPTFAHEALIAIAFLLRKPMIQQAEGLTPRLASYGATFIMPVFCFISSRWQLGWMKSSASPLFVVGVLMWIVGSYLGLFSLFRLRASFSIVPQARALVTSGPYRVARHPIYASYLLQYGGVTLAYLALPTFITFLVWLAVMMARVSYEESVLTRAFPEYEDYRRHVGMFAPRLSWRPGSAHASPVLIKAKAAAHRWK